MPPDYTPDALGHKPTDRPDTKLDAERTLTAAERSETFTDAKGNVRVKAGFITAPDPLAIHEGGQSIKASSQPEVEASTGTPHDLQKTPDHLAYLPHEHALHATRAAVDPADSNLSLTDQAKHVHKPAKDDAKAAKVAGAFYDEDQKKPVDPNDERLGDALVQLQGTLGDGVTNAAHAAHAATLHPGQGGPEILDKGLPVDEANQQTQVAETNEAKDPSPKERKVADKAVKSAVSPAKAQAKGGVKSAAKHK